MVFKLIFLGLVLMLDNWMATQDLNKKMLLKLKLHIDTAIKTNFIATE